MNKDSHLDSLLKQIAEDHHPQLPSPGLIWWRAQILRKQQEQARIERPVTIMRMVGLVVCMVVFTVMVSANRELFTMLLADENWLLLPLGIVLLAASLVVATTLRTFARRR
jgi:hypothetical protein